MKIFPLILALLFVCGCENGKTDTDSQPANAPSKTDSMPAKSDGAGASEVAINDSCPIMDGHSIAKGVTTVYEGTTIGFCCPGCIDKFNGKSDEEKAAIVAKLKQ